MIGGTLPRDSLLRLLIAISTATLIGLSTPGAAATDPQSPSLLTALASHSTRPSMFKLDPLAALVYGDLCTSKQDSQFGKSRNELLENQSCQP